MQVSRVSRNGLQLRMPSSCAPLPAAPPQNKVPSESEDSRARMLAALQQKQRELAGGAFNNPVSAAQLGFL